MWVRGYGATAIPEYGGFPSVHGRCSEPSDEDVPKSFGSFLIIWPDVAGYCARVSFSFRRLMCIQKNKNLVVHGTRAPYHAHTSFRLLNAGEWEVGGHCFYPAFSFER